MTPIEDPCANMDDGYLLIDVLNFPDFDLEGFYSVPCIPSSLANSQELMPRLVDIKNMSLLQTEQMKEIFRQQADGDNAFAICSWIESDLQLDELAEHVARFLYGPGPGADNAKVLWRFFDPRVFAITIQIFSLEQLLVLMGPIKSWRFTWCANWWVVSQKMEMPCQFLVSEEGWPNKNQWLIIQRSRLLSNVMNALIEDKKITAKKCLEYSKASINYLEECIQSLDVMDEDDQLEFVYLCVKYGSSYRNHPKLALQWARLKDKKISWTNLRLQLNALDLEKLNLLSNF